MRISDWSSDVCSSDLLPWNPGARNGARMDDVPDTLLAALPRAASGEVFTELLPRPGVRLERIVSAGPPTPAAAPTVPASDEWVLLLAGAGGFRRGDGPHIALAPVPKFFLHRGLRPTA